MTRYMTVRVVDTTGRPKKGARVRVYRHGILSGGFLKDVYTDEEGKAEFELTEDCRITFYVDGKEIRPGERKPEAYVKLIV